jgi:hypothetical protein
MPPLELSSEQMAKFVANVGLDVVYRNMSYELIWGIEKLEALRSANVTSCWVVEHELNDDGVAEARLMSSWPRCDGSCDPVRHAAVISGLE